ncbi:MAG TPA: hypothetical protein VIF82_15970 [Burkholderiaceae bacterium]|jgi:hypothetical protein
MKTWGQALRDGAVSGAIAAAASAAALAARGKHESGTPFGPVNAISHWIWGDEAAQHNAPSSRYSLLGYMIHHSASTLWATIYEKWFGKHADIQAENREIGKILAGGIAVSALACFVDYKMTPHRLQPGYEMRLSSKSLLIVYAAFGLGLALRGLVTHHTTALRSGGHCIDFTAKAALPD